METIDIRDGKVKLDQVNASLKEVEKNTKSVESSSKTRWGVIAAGIGVALGVLQKFIRLGAAEEDQRAGRTEGAGTSVALRGRTGRFRRKPDGGGGCMPA